MAIGRTISAVRDQMGSELLQNSSLEGRLEKYLVDLGWEDNLVVYFIYGKTGGSKAAEQYANSLPEAVHQEVWSTPARPTIILWGIRSDPSDLPSVRAMTE